MRYFIEFAYNGKAYCGWQRQPDVLTVQEVLEEAISTVLQQNIDVFGAGRTDTGVHAKQMYAHFDLEDPISDSKLVFKFNQLLPKDIAVKAIHQVKDDAHARFDALSRSYEYVITEKKNPFQIESAYFIKNKLDIDRMNQASKTLFNYKNFKSFSKVHTDVKTYNCKMMFAQWDKKEDNVVFTITADRFLRNMVRAIVGTMIDIGSGKHQVEYIKSIIESQDRSQAGTSAPAHGLYLTRIEYPEEIFVNGR